jgi:hypothetical protein
MRRTSKSRTQLHSRERNFAYPWPPKESITCGEPPLAPRRVTSSSSSSVPFVVELALTCPSPLRRVRLPKLSLKARSFLALEACPSCPP